MAKKLVTKLTLIATIGLAIAGWQSFFSESSDEVASVKPEEKQSLTLGADASKAIASTSKSVIHKPVKVSIKSLPPIELNSPISKHIRFETTNANPLRSDQLVLKVADGSKLFKLAKTSPDEVSKQLSDAAKASVKFVRFAGDAIIVKIAYKFNEKNASALAKSKDRDSQFASITSALKTVPGVLGFEEDPVFHPTVAVNDPMFAEQWYLQQAVPGASNTFAGWEKTRGKAASGDAVMAIVDTGITRHSDLNGNVLPGFDFVSDAARANDGNGWDADSTDAGDSLSASEIAVAGSPFEGCMERTRSSWHGTHVTGIAAAVGNNGMGVIGVASEAKILPVRVMGKCGGYMTDIAAGIRWASGQSIVGAPVNPNPAKIINLSLGGASVCPSYLQSSISSAIAAGSVVVVAAGNANVDARNIAPANCSGVIVVGAVGQTGERAYYSDFGSSVAISAPGGDARDGATILSTMNSGSSAPGGESYEFYQGTSMAAPVVAGGIAMVMGAHPNLSPSAAFAFLKRFVRPFPADSTCAKLKNCGAGIIDVGAAVEVIAKPDIVIAKFQISAPVIVPNIPFDGIIKIANLGTMPVGLNQAGEIQVFIASAIDGSNPVMIAKAPVTNISGMLMRSEKLVKITGLKIGSQTPFGALEPGKYSLFATFIGGDWEINDTNGVSNRLMVDYVFPNFSLTKKQYIKQAPADITFTALFDDSRIQRLAIGKDWVYDWSFSNGNVIKASLGVAKLQFTEPGQGTATLKLRHIPSGFESTATSQYEVVQAAPPEVTFTEMASNQYLRVPVSIRFNPKITTGHPLDRPIAINWDINDGQITKAFSSPTITFDKPGQQVVKTTVKTKMGFTTTAEKVIILTENSAPVCSLDYVNPPGQVYVTFTANCNDTDGRIKGINWIINGRSIATPAGNPFVYKYPTTERGTVNVIVRVFDDSKAFGETQITVAH